MTTAPVSAADSQKQRGQTLYHILRGCGASGDEGPPKYELLSLDVPGNNAAHAVTMFLNERVTKPLNGRYVAIPARSWKELPASVEQTTVVKVGEPT